MKSLGCGLVEEGLRERSVHVEADSSMVLEMVVDSLQALVCKLTSSSLMGGTTLEEEEGFLLL